jgi:hypothetical protein
MMKLGKYRATGHSSRQGSAARDRASRPRPNADQRSSVNGVETATVSTAVEIHNPNWQDLHGRDQAISPLHRQGNDPTGSECRSFVTVTR